jgi:ligand-binding sensor protein
MPTRPPSFLHFMNVEKLQSILTSIGQQFSVQMQLVDTYGRGVTGTQSSLCPIGEHLARLPDCLCTRCVDTLIEHARTDSPFALHRCSAGAARFAVPIPCFGETLCYVLSSAVFPQKPSPGDWAHLRDELHTNTKHDQLASFLMQIPVVSVSDLERLANLVSPVVEASINTDVLTLSMNHELRGALQDIKGRADFLRSAVPILIPR